MKVAAYFGSREIYYDMLTSCKSLLVNSDVDKVYLLIEDDEFPFELDNTVEVINISKIVPQMFRPDSPNYNSRWTYIGLIRAALPKVFPQYDRLLSIDCDTVVLQDISELWDLDLDDYYLAGVKEPILSGQHGSLYVNAGVIMMNLAKMREDGIDDALIEDLNTHYRCFVSQDAINGICRGHILELPGQYNASYYTTPVSEWKIHHFAGGFPKGWRDSDEVKEYREMTPLLVSTLHANQLINHRLM